MCLPLQLGLDLGASKVSDPHLQRQRSLIFYNFPQNHPRRLVLLLSLVNMKEDLPRIRQLKQARPPSLPKSAVLWTLKTKVGLSEIETCRSPSV